jgi:hypothetical protein
MCFPFSSLLAGSQAILGPEKAGSFGEVGMPIRLSLVRRKGRHEIVIEARRAVRRELPQFSSLLEPSR